MGRIVSNFFMTLDGVVESPHEWHFPYFDEQMGAAVDEGTGASQAFLVGRRLYEEWATYWPEHADADDFGPFINGIDKYVVSDSLETADWENTTIISGDVAARVRELKDATDGDIGISGSATLVRWLLANDLLDELRLLIDPIVVGKGQRLFEGAARQPLELVEQEAFGTGVLHLVYAPAATPEGS